MFDGNLNKNLYLDFKKSKLADSIKEYSDTTKRIFKATGIINFDNGFVELAHKELLEEILDEDYLYNNIFGKIKNILEYNSFEKYERLLNGFFCSSLSFIEIFHYSETDVENILDSVKNKFSNTSLKDITKVLSNKRNQEFVKFIDDTYPLDKVKNILNMFNDRSNDKKIKEMVCPDSSVPTIYEYMIGIAWYYFSGKRINLLESFNLTLSANFEPLMHAGGGQGDIVIYEEDKVVMLEATLMNANSQKRGEWEPVLRHSANLKIEEECNNTGRDVTTFFIADTFDYNTINIWKAVSAVSLQSSIDKEKFTENVIIMPISTSELISLMDKSNDYDKIICKVRSLFNENRIAFDFEWRKRFIDEIV
ncbi:MAG: AlwI family type II restriction endonuclease [Spirochaetaceae bacterium]|nr:AlwI family type II restriction endonuclease [Spirochaetaceae bacterium]